MNYKTKKLSLLALSLPLMLLLNGCHHSYTSTQEPTTFLTFTNTQKADVVIGQKDFNSTESSSEGNISANRFRGFLYDNAYINNGKLFISDYEGNRILVYNSIPTKNNANADYVIGQASLTSSDLNKTTANLISGPGNVIVANGKLLVADYDNDRVLIYNTIPTENNASADIVIGQADLYSNNNEDNRTTICNAQQFTLSNILVVGDKLLISDDNNRVLIYNHIPTENNASADFVLGQNSLTTCIANDDDQDGKEDNHPTARTFHSPNGMWSDGKKLVINDYFNNRTLIWNTFPTENFTPADVVLGQNNFDMQALNDDDQDGQKDSHPTARTLRHPYDGVTSNSKQLFIADYGNNRVLIWNTFPTKNFTPADVVLGQKDMNTRDINCTKITASSLCFPDGVAITNSELFVTDSENNRVLIFNSKN